MVWDTGVGTIARRLKTGFWRRIDRMIAEIGNATVVTMLRSANVFNIILIGRTERNSAVEAWIGMYLYAYSILSCYHSIIH